MSFLVMFYYKTYVAMTKGLHVLSKNINATALTLPLFWGSLLVGLWFLHMLAISLLGVLICTLFYVFSLEVNSTTHQVTPFPKVTFSVCLLSFGLSLAGTLRRSHIHTCSPGICGDSFLVLLL